MACYFTQRNPCSIGYFAVVMNRRNRTSKPAYLVLASTYSATAIKPRIFRYPLFYSLIRSNALFSRLKTGTPYHHFGIYRYGHPCLILFSTKKSTICSLFHSRVLPSEYSSHSLWLIFSLLRVSIYSITDGMSIPTVSDNMTVVIVCKGTPPFFRGSISG